jgi:hypothetical protein
MVLTQEPDHYRYIVHTLMVGNKYDRSAYRQVLFIDEHYPVAQYVISTYQEKVQNVNRPLMGLVTKCIKTDPLNWVENN